MSRSAITVRVWSIYVLLIGVLLAVAPNFVLSTLGLDETEEPWIRVLGLIVVLLALYYDDAVRNEARHFFFASVVGRLFFAVALIILVITGEPWQLLIFAALDVAGAVWTLNTLRAETRAQS